MTRRFIQPRIWLKRFDGVSDALNRQLVELQLGIVQALSTAADALTGKNLGTGARVWRDKIPGFLRFRTLRGLQDVTVAENADLQHIDVSSNLLGDNVGSGARSYRDKTSTLNFRRHTGTGGIVVSEDGDTIEHDGSALQWTATGYDQVDADFSSQQLIVRASRDRASVTTGTDIVDLTGLDAIDLIDIYPSADITFHSLSAPTANGTTRKYIRHRGTDFTISFPHESATGTTAQRFATPQEATIVLRLGESCIIDYTPAAPTRWWVTGQAIPEGVEITPTAGLGALGEFRPVRVGGESIPWSGSTEAELVFIPGANEWLRLGLGGFEGPAEDQIFAGTLYPYALEYLEGGETGAGRLLPSGSAGGWGGNLINATGLPGTGILASTARTPIHADCFPWNGGYRVVVFYSRTSGVTSTNNCAYNDEAGRNAWTPTSFTFLSEAGPTAKVWTGTSYIVGFPGGEIERSTDGCETWSSVTPPDSNGRYIALSNGDSIVLLVGANAVIRSDDDGLTWEEVLDGFVLRQALFHKGTFYIWTAAGVYTSADGGTWAGPTAISLSSPGYWDLSPFANFGRGVVNCGDVMVMLMVEPEDAPESSDNSPTSGLEDLYWSRDGIAWQRSTSFQNSFLMLPNGTNTGDPHPNRVRIASSSPKSPGYPVPDWHQLHVVPSTSYSDGLCDTYLGPRDYGGTTTVFDAGDAPEYTGLPTPVGGAASAGISPNYARGDRHRDIGKKGPDIASASTIDLDASTGDYGHITGTTTIDTVTLAEGLRRERVFDDALTLEHSANLILESGADETTVPGELWLFRGEGSDVVRAWRLSGDRHQDTFAVDLNYDPDADYDSGDADSFRELDGNLLVSVTALDVGHTGLALLSRMQTGGFARAERRGAPLENIEYRVGPPTNNVTHLAFPILERFQTFHAFDPSLITASNFARSTTYSFLSTARGIDLSPDGYNALVINRGSDTIYSLRLHKPRDFSAYYITGSFVTTTWEGNPNHAVWGPTGERVYWCGNASNAIRQIDCDEPYSLGGTPADSGAGITGAAGALGLAINQAENKLLVVANGPVINQYNFGTPGDISTNGGIAETLDLSAWGTGLVGIAWCNGGSTILAVGSASDTIFRINLSDPDDVSTGTLGTASASLTSIAAVAWGLCATPDGSRVYLLDETTKNIYEWQLSDLTEDVVYRVGFWPQEQVYKEALSSLDDTTTYDSAYCTFSKALFPANAVTSCLLVYTFGTIVGEISDEADERDGSVMLLASVTTNGGEIVKTNAQTHYFDSSMKAVPAALAATDDENGFMHIYGGTGSGANFVARTAIDGSGNLRAYLDNGTDQAFHDFAAMASVCTLKILDDLRRGELAA